MTTPQTNAAKLAADYLKLGGTLRGKLDDNIVDTKQWDDEPEEASTFWNELVQSLPDERRREVETNLPTMNSD